MNQNMNKSKIFLHIEKRINLRLKSQRKEEPFFGLNTMEVDRSETSQSEDNKRINDGD